MVRAAARRGRPGRPGPTHRRRARRDRAARTLERPQPGARVRRPVLPGASRRVGGVRGLRRPAAPPGPRHRRADAADPCSADPGRAAPHRAVPLPRRHRGVVHPRGAPQRRRHRPHADGRGRPARRVGGDRSRPGPGRRRRRALPGLPPAVARRHPALLGHLGAPADALGRDPAPGGRARPRDGGPRPDPRRRCRRVGAAGLLAGRLDPARGQRPQRLVEPAPNRPGHRAHRESLPARRGVRRAALEPRPALVRGPRRRPDRRPARLWRAEPRAAGPAHRRHRRGVVRPHRVVRTAVRRGRPCPGGGRGGRPAVPGRLRRRDHRRGGRRVRGPRRRRARGVAARPGAPHLPRPQR